MRRVSLLGCSGCTRAIKELGENRNRTGARGRVSGAIGASAMCSLAATIIGRSR